MQCILQVFKSVAVHKKDSDPQVSKQNFHNPGCPAAADNDNNNNDTGKKSEIS